MNQYVTGAMIKRLRENRKMTQHVRYTGNVL